MRRVSAPDAEHSVVDRTRVDQLLALLGRYLRILRDLSDVPRDEYVTDPRNYGSGERFLQLAYEDVDPALVHELLRTRLGDFDRFAEAVTAYLDHADTAEG